MDGQMSLFVPGSCSGRTSPARSVPTKAATSSACLRNASESRNRPRLTCLSLKKDGQKPELSWETDGALLGELLTRSFGESPSVVVESALWRILEDTPHPKYSLSAKACLGILRRAERRGKTLPEPLKVALIRQSQEALPQEWTEVPVSTEGPEIIVQNGVKCLNPWDSQSGRVYDADGVFHSLVSCENAGMQRDAVLTDCVIPIHDKATRYQGGGDTRHDDGSGNGLGVGKSGDPCPTLSTADRHAVYDARGNGDGETVCTLTGDHANRVTDYTPIVARCITANCYKQKGRADAETYLSKGGIARRLTPLECERLQGFPDGWTDIGTWTDSKGKRRECSDSARYRALGNSIALPPWKWVLKRLSAQYERDATLGSLFDGIGGFPLIWEQINGKGSALWASEIEDFCIAVTRKRFG